MIHSTFCARVITRFAPVKPALDVVLHYYSNIIRSRNISSDIYLFTKI